MKIKLTIAINFISSEDNDEERVMHPNSNSIKFMIYDNATEVIEKRFQSILNRYQIVLKTPVRGCNLIFDFDYFL